MKNTFAPVFSGILDSSLWEEPYEVRILFVSMLALKDSDHVVRFNDYQLHRRANLKLEEVVAALKILEEPDNRRTGQAHEGRRIQKVEGGWLMLNGQHYENQMREVSRRAYQARMQREYRAREKQKEQEAKAVAAAQQPAPPTPEPPKTAPAVNLGSGLSEAQMAAARKAREVAEIKIDSMGGMHPKALKAEPKVEQNDDQINPEPEDEDPGVPW